MPAESRESVRTGMRKIERSEWWLSWSAIAITLLLTAGIASFALPMLHHDDEESTAMQLAVRGLLGLVLLFDVYAVYQQVQIHKIRRRLLEREELFKLISENAVDMIAVVDADGRRIYNSPSYERILGYTADYLRDTSPLEQIHPDDLPLVLKAAKEAQHSGVGRRIEYRMRRKDGEWLFLESTASAVRNADGAVEKLVIVNRDISERRQLEEQLRQSQKMDAIGRLSGGVAHDFNNLLGVIIGYTEVLQDHIKEGDSLRVCVDQVLEAGKRAASLTRQLLAFSRQQVLEPKVLILNAVVSDMEKMLRRMIGEDVELTTKLDPQLGKVRADQGQIEQVIMNLAVNARDAMPEGGKLSIKTSNTEMDEAFVKHYAYPVQPGAYILLTVSDTGTGMDNVTRQRIFEPFFTTKEKGKGTGLGLSMVYGVVKQSGGYIDVDSIVGKGTTFNIYLPRINQNENVDTTQINSPAVLQGKETILLVEDEKNLRTLTRNLLELYGYSVLDAENGADALTISRQTTTTIHLLLTDIVMPEIGGRALAQKLSNERPDMKVVYMSGYTGQTIGGQAVLNPGAFFLQKPFTRENLARKIREALEISDGASVVPFDSKVGEIGSSKE
jgi:two-component system cell cycle sensor histidine kinase/response regulator CckA